MGGINRLFIGIALVCCCLGLSDVAARAQATRTWVSGVGDDANPCSRTAPCKTFAGAISKTATNGEINVLDPGGFGAVTITKAISIIDDGVGEAGVLVSGTNGIIIQAGPSDRVILRGLTFDGIGYGLNGVQVNSAGSVVIDNCRIFGFVQAGILLQPNSATNIEIRNTEIVNNTGASAGGILVKPQGGRASVTLDRVTAEFNPFGLRVDGTASAQPISVTVRDSTLSNNTASGLAVATGGAGGTATVAADHDTLTGNGLYGVLVAGAQSSVLLGGAVVTGNGTGLYAASGGYLGSYGTNAVNGNGKDGAPSAVLTLK